MNMLMTTLPVLVLMRTRLLVGAVRDRLHSDERGLQIAESMAIAAFAIVAISAIFAALTNVGTEVVNWIQSQLIN